MESFLLILAASFLFGFCYGSYALGKRLGRFVARFVNRVLLGRKSVVREVSEPHADV